jgi:hypothetical protein
MAKSNVKLALDEEEFFNADKSAKSTDDLAFIEGSILPFIIDINIFCISDVCISVHVSRKGVVYQLSLMS